MLSADLDPAPRSHHLDHVRSGLQLGTHCLSDLIGAIGLAREIPVVSPGARDGAAAREDTRSDRATRFDEIAKLDVEVVPRAELARGRDAFVEGLSRVPQPADNLSHS